MTARTRDPDLIRLSRRAGPPHPLRAIAVSYDGYGDSGGVEGVTGEDHAGGAANVRRLLGGGDTDTLCDFALDAVCRLYPGFENNEGACGTVTFDLAALRVSVSHTDRYSEEHHSEMSLDAQELAALDLSDAGRRALDALWRALDAAGAGSTCVEYSVYGDDVDVIKQHDNSTSLPGSLVNSTADVAAAIIRSIASEDGSGTITFRAHDRSVAISHTAVVDVEGDPEHTDVSPFEEA